MTRTLSLFIVGLFCTSLFLGGVSVYVFHDVDQDKIGHWNEAFADLSAEIAVFDLIVGGSVWALTLLGRRLFKLHGSSPRARLGLGLGIAVPILQYLFDFAGRAFIPNYADFALYFLLVAAIFLCTAALLFDTLRQQKLLRAIEPTSMQVDR